MIILSYFFMREKYLIIFSLFVLIIGLISLFISLNLGSAKLIASVQEIPDNNLISFQAIVTGEHSTADGFVLELSKTQTIIAYLNASLNSSFKNKMVLVTGRKDDDWFNIYSIELV